MHVRLKPYDRKRGHVLRTYCIYGVRFLEKRGWYEVPKSLAKKLETIPQRPTDENSPRAFDVKTKEEAEIVDVKAQETPVRREAKDANPVRVQASRLPDEDEDDGADDAPPAKPSKRKSRSSR